MHFIWLAYFVLTTANVVLSQNDIQVDCGKDSFTIRWKVSEALADAPFKLLLGDCFPSKFSATDDGRGEAVFRYRFSDCNFRQTKTPEKLIYENELTFKPLTKWDTGEVVHPVKCVLERDFSVEKPAFGVLAGQGVLTFHMGVLNSDLSGPAESNIFPLGSLINIWASVAQQAHQSLILYFEECVASSNLAVEPASTYPIITNNGCLVDGKTAASRFLPRDQLWSLVLQLQTFKFAAEQEVYIHCKLAVWDPEDFSEENKACNYNKATERWELLDDPFQSDLCRCCDSYCSNKMRLSHEEPQRPSQSSVLGPLFLTATK